MRRLQLQMGQQLTHMRQMQARMQQMQQMQQVQQMQQQLLMLMPQQGLMLGAMQQLPPGGQPPQQSAPDSPSARLSKLDEYKQRGIITAEEHADQRAKIISALGI